MSPPRALKNEVKQAHELADDLFGQEAGGRKLTREPHKPEEVELKSSPGLDNRREMRLRVISVPLTRDPKMGVHD